ncbi:MAG: EAL domain-containing protein, partial [Myxococcales bacterium]|nr:EAL domain-containing protein [Myxococcales bacterium]
MNQGEVMRVLPKPFDGATLVEAVTTSLTAFDERGRKFESAESRAEAGALETCLHSDLLALAVQPIVHAKNHSIFAYEALLRSRHEELNTPLKVLAAAERSGRISELSDAIAVLSDGWLERIGPEALLFLNLHPQILAEPERVRAYLNRFGQGASRIVMEITERADLRHVPRAEESLSAIRSTGARIAVDDVGAGASTLSLLADVQPEFIKIDMS